MQPVVIFYSLSVFFLYHDVHWLENRKPHKCAPEMTAKRMWGRLGCDLFNSNKLLFKNEKAPLISALVKWI